MIFDFRLKVFDTVARRMSFTKAANELNITQPAISKQIKELEQQLGAKLFERNGTKISISESGEILQKYTAKLFDLYRALEFDINAINDKLKGTITIGASTTIAQYILAPVIADFKSLYKDIEILLTIDNSETITALLLEQKIDLAIVEGETKDPSVSYTQLMKDEIVLAISSKNKLSRSSHLTLKQLEKVPLILREQGSGTLEIVNKALKKCGMAIDTLNVEMRLSNTETIKAYLQHSNCGAFISIYAILKEVNANSLSIIDVKGLSITRNFNLAEKQGEQSKVVRLFKNFALRYNHK